MHNTLIHISSELQTFFSFLFYMLIKIKKFEITNK